MPAAFKILWGTVETVEGPVIHCKLMVAASASGIGGEFTQAGSFTLKAGDFPYLREAARGILFEESETKAKGLPFKIICDPAMPENTFRLVSTPAHPETKFVKREER